MKEVRTDDQLKEMVREKYASIAVDNTKGGACCGIEGGCGPEYSFIGDDYGSQEGYVKEADLNLGCGLPTEFAGIRKGDTVVDLGSGAGNDVFIARAETGPMGHVLGLDFTQEMIDLAQKNATKLGFENVEFVKGDIEAMPIADAKADVVVSNCVLNLVPDKRKAYQETFRILKPGGHFSISDVVVEGEIPEELKEQAEMYAGCVSGSIPLAEYMNVVKETGFVDMQIQKKRQIQIPPEIIDQFLNEEQKSLYEKANLGIFSITLLATKPKGEDCCGPTCCN